MNLPNGGATSSVPPEACAPLARQAGGRRGAVQAKPQAPAKASTAVRPPFFSGPTLHIGQALICVGLLVLWEWGCRQGWIDSSLLPPPSQVGPLVASLPVEASFWDSLGRTLSSSMTGLLLAILVGVPAGIAIGASPAVYRATRMLVDIGRSFPVVALMPVLVLLMGTTPKMLITVAMLATVWPILIQSSYWVRCIEPLVYDTARAFRIPAIYRFTHVMLPTAAPYVATGIRVAASFALLVTIGVELLSSTPGLGREIALAQEGGNFPLVMAYVFYCGLLGLTLNAVLSRAEKAWLGWHTSIRVNP